MQQTIQQQRGTAIARKVDIPHIRVDADFPDDESFARLPKAARCQAYCFLLAITGWSRLKLTDGRVPLSIASGLARKMEVDGNRCLDALFAESLVLTIDPETLFIPKYEKWQVTAAEIDDIRAQAAAAGARGGRVKASNRLATATPEPSDRLNDASDVPLATARQKPSRVEKSREERQDVASPNGDAQARRERSRQVKAWWTDHHGILAGKFDRDDAQLIEKAVVIAYPPEFWKAAIARVPKGAKFRYLTTPPEEGKVARLEDWFIRWQEARLRDRKAEEGDVPSIGELIQRGAA